MANNTASHTKNVQKGDKSLPLYDAGGTLTATKLREIKEIFNTAGGLHITNTGLKTTQDLLPLLADLGFSEDEQFVEGGRTSAAKQEKWKEAGLRRMDFYPPHLYLLPNNEIQYQRNFPSRVLFFCENPADEGGRTFLHSAQEAKEIICALGETGKQLYEKLEEHGMSIEVGFLDQNDPRKKDNYFKSWQELCGTDDKDEAVKAIAKDHSDTFDECWWKEHEGHSVLMTQITLPSVYHDARDGQSYLRFPRIAMNGPSIENGFRRFPLGNGEDLSAEEIQILRDAYIQTQQGYEQSAGDIILMDNIRFGHSREPFEGTREVYLSMAGHNRINKPQI